MCHAVNVGITRAMTRGIVRSTNLMAPCPWFADAVSRAKTHGLNVGVHLCVTAEWDRLRWGPITRAPSLTGPDGYFPTSFPALDRIARDEEVFAEFEAQIQRIRAAGIEPTHADNHMLSPRDYRDCVMRFRDITRRVCQKHGLFQIRDHAAEGGFVHAVDRLEITGQSESHVWQLLESCTRPGVYELVAHVAAPTPELDSICSVDHPDSQWAAPYRVTDLTFLTRASTRRRIEDLGFELVDVPTVKALSPGARTGQPDA